MSEGIEVYHGDVVYLEGTYTREQLRRIMTTLERIMVANADLGRQAKPEGYQTMDETIPVPEVGWMTLPRE
jgi:hypothetical protein